MLAILICADGANIIYKVESKVVSLEHAHWHAYFGKDVFRLRMAGCGATFSHDQTPRHNRAHYRYQSRLITNRLSIRNRMDAKNAC